MSVKGRIIPFPRHGDGECSTKRCFRLKICFLFTLERVLELSIIVTLCVLIKNVKGGMSRQTVCVTV